MPTVAVKVAMLLEVLRYYVDCSTVRMLITDYLPKLMTTKAQNAKQNKQKTNKQTNNDNNTTKVQV